MNREFFDNAKYSKEWKPLVLDVEDKLTIYFGYVGSAFTHYIVNQVNIIPNGICTITLNTEHYKRSMTINNPMFISNIQKWIKNLAHIGLKIDDEEIYNNVGFYEGTITVEGCAQIIQSPIGMGGFGY
jgi:hypothetical protein